MWFIQGDMIAKVFLCVLLFAVFTHCLKQEKAKYLQPVSIALSLALLTVFSWRLSCFYVVYILFTYGMLRLMKKIKTARKFVFVFLCVLFVVPFLLGRTLDRWSPVSQTLVLVGFSYNMLKAVDALFYVYYTDMPIPFLSYSNFILFFPVFTAGPIFRYRDFARQFQSLRPVTLDGISLGLRRFILGMFKKVVLVTILTSVFDVLCALPEYHWYSSLAVLFFAYVILYVDLSGYSDMAVGVGRMMSVEVPENFKKPWTAPSFTQFWRKWHVTLSDWIREHIFVVVQDKKLKKSQSALIGMITMIVMSLWHEFSVMTVIGGVYMGLFLVIENLFSLSTFNVRKEKKYKFVIRCILVNFFFAVNALTFSLDLGKIGAVLAGLIR